jgi:alpha-beta hydrolase superfamily lysophospholipase
MRKASSILPLLLSTAAGTLGGALSIAWYVSRRVNPLPRRTYIDTYTFTPWELGVPYEEISLRTPDGLNLRGWWLPRPESRSVVIGCHGHTSFKADLLGIGTRTWRAGHNVLLFDFRGRGESDPWPNTLVGREVQDLLTAVAYARERAPGAHIGTVGYSMGAAVSILAAAQEPAIAALVIDSPFAVASEVVAASMRQVMRFPPEPLLTIADALIERQHGYRLSRVRPIDVIGGLAPRPILFIHGTSDSAVPVSHAHRLFAAAGQPKELWLCEGAEHCGAYFADRNTYVARVTAFFDQYLRSLEL